MVPINWCTLASLYPLKEGKIIMGRNVGPPIEKNAIRPTALLHTPSLITGGVRLSTEGVLNNLAGKFQWAIINFGTFEALPSALSIFGTLAHQANKDASPYPAVIVLEVQSWMQKITRTALMRKCGYEGPIIYVAHTATLGIGFCESTKQWVNFTESISATFIAELILSIPQSYPVQEQVSTE